MRALGLALAILVATASGAAARCADDVAAIDARIGRVEKEKPSSQTALARKQMKKLNDDLKQMDEVDCYNALARIRRTLSTAPPEDQAAKKDVGPVKK